MKYNDLNPTVVFLVGLPGTGKSTFTKKFLADNPEKDYVVLSTDDLIEVWAEEEGLTYAEAWAQYAKRADKQFKINFRQTKNLNQNMIIDRTNLTMKGRNRLLCQLPKEYYKIAITFNVGETELKQRLDRREIETGKHIPDHVVQNMRNSFQEPHCSEFDEIRTA